VNISGGEFRLDGALLDGLETVGSRLPLNLPAGSVLSGTLADGTPFAFSGLDNDSIADGTLTLDSAALPAIGPAVIRLPADPAPLGIRAGQTLGVAHRGVVGDNFNAGWGSTVNVERGEVGANFEAMAAHVTISGGVMRGDFDAFGDSTVNISGGVVGDDFNAFGGSTVAISGGSVGHRFEAKGGSEVNISGGSVGAGFTAFSGSTVSITGGTFGHSFVAFDGSTVTITGGSMGDFFCACTGSTVNISGGEFRLDDMLVDGLGTVGSEVALDVPDGSVFSGTLADGTPFAFSSLDLDFIGSNALTLQAAALPDIGPPLIALPGDVAPRGIRSGQTLFIQEGGWVGDNFNAGWGSIVDIVGGRVGRNFEAVGAEVSISDGYVGERFGAFAGSTVAISGGTIGRFFTSVGSTVNITSGMFDSGFGAREGSTVNVSGGSFPDGFDAREGSLVNISGGSFAGGFDVRDGSTLNITGGSIGRDSLVSLGSTVNVSGGSIGDDFDAITDSTVNISGGTIGDDFSASNGRVPGSGSTVNISGGSVGDRFSVRFGSTVNISGGTVADDFAVSGGFSNANISGGSVGNRFIAHNGSTVNISGGAIGDGFQALDGSVVNMSGGQFRLDGVLINGLETAGDNLGFNLPDNSVLSGTLADGTPFAFSRLDSDLIAESTLTLEVAPIQEIGPAVITVPGEVAPLGIRNGQTLIVENGGVVADHFNAGAGSSVQVIGGQVGDNFEATTALVTISGGTVGDQFDAFIGSTVNIVGGSVGENFDAYAGSAVNVSGGSMGALFGAHVGSAVNILDGEIGSDFSAHDGTIVNIFAGTIGTYFNAHGGSLVNISGGNFLGQFQAHHESEVNLFGTQFVIDGMDITDSLIVNEPVTVNTRGVTLSGMFADGSAFSFDLNSRLVFGEDRFFSLATLTITLVPMRIAGDTNWDGTVDIDDLNNVRNNFGETGSVDGSLVGDAWPFDGRVDIDDLNAVRNNFGAVATAVPEPAAAWLAVWGVLAFALRRRRSAG